MRIQMWCVGVARCVRSFLGLDIGRRFTWWSAPALRFVWTTLLLSYRALLNSIRLVLVTCRVS